VKADLMRNKSLYFIAVLGILLVSLVDFTASLDSEMLIGTLLSWIPYLIVAAIHRSFISSRKRINSLKGGLLIYLAIDLFVRYQALHHSGSSTDAIAVGIILISSVIIIPIGFGITYLLLSLVNYGNQS
jgi:hypothetical protein